LLRGPALITRWLPDVNLPARTYRLRCRMAGPLLAVVM